MGRELRCPSQSRRMDETHVRVAGKWACLYRAVDSNGIDFLLSPKRDLIARRYSCGWLCPRAFGRK